MKINYAARADNVCPSIDGTIEPSATAGIFRRLRHRISSSVSSNHAVVSWRLWLTKSTTGIKARPYTAMKLLWCAVYPYKFSRSHPWSFFRRTCCKVPQINHYCVVTSHEAPLKQRHSVWSSTVSQSAGLVYETLSQQASSTRPRLSVYKEVRRNRASLVRARCFVVTATCNVSADHLKTEALYRLSWIWDSR